MFLEQPVWFVPGRPIPPEWPLARYRPLRPGGVTEYVERLTAPGDLVLDLFCQGPAFLKETVRVGRRGLGLSVNPISLLIAGLGLDAAAAISDLSAAFTHLADSPKGELPIRRHILSLYSTTCPLCASEGVAEWFAWDREANRPYAKAVRCPRCEEIREGPVDERDISRAAPARASSNRTGWPITTSSTASLHSTILLANGPPSW